MIGSAERVYIESARPSIDDQGMQVSKFIELKWALKRVDGVGDVRPFVIVRVSRRFPPRGVRLRSTFTSPATQIYELACLYQLSAHATTNALSWPTCYIQSLNRSSPFIQLQIQATNSLF